MLIEEEVDDDQNKPLEEQLRGHILNGKKEGLEGVLDEH